MNLRTTKWSADEEDDWEIISTTDWWHTSVSAARWSFAPTQHAVESLAPRRQFCGSLFYKGFAVDSRSRSSSKERRNTDDDDTLNVELDGVKSSMDALSVYERHVGFHLDIRITPLVSQDVIDLTVAVDEKDLLVRKKVWDELLDGLMNGPAFGNHADSDESLESSFIGEDLLRSTSTISSIGTSFSEGSFDSVGMPSTPKPKSSFSDVEIKDLSPSGSVNGSMDYNISPRRSLNATASSFVPTFSQTKDEPLQFPSLDPSSPHTSFANFTFPTLNPPSEIKSDDHVFHPTTQGPGLLPPFLQESPSQRNRYRKSRTREIVDRLRSKSSPVDVVSPKFASHSSSPIIDHSNVVTPRLSISEDGSRLSTPSFEEEDAWIDLTPPTVTSSSSPTQKARRTRELFLALTRRRTDSLSSENVKDMMTASEGSAISSSQPPSRNVSSQSSPLPHSPPSLAASTEGWVEGFAPLEPQKPLQRASNSSRDSSQHSRKKSSNHTSRASTSSSNSHSQLSHHFHSHGVSLSSVPSSTSQHHPHQLHQHPLNHQYRHHHHASSPSTFSATSPYLPRQQHTHHHSMLSTPAPTTMPYFFPAYPAVPMPVPFTSFMHMPATAAYHVPGSVQPMHVAPHHPMYGAAAAQQSTLMRGSMVPPPPTKQSLTSTTPSTTTNMIMNMTPDIYKGKHSPLW